MLWRFKILYLSSVCTYIFCVWPLFISANDLLQTGMPTLLLDSTHGNHPNLRCISNPPVSSSALAFFLCIQLDLTLLPTLLTGLLSVIDHFCLLVSGLSLVMAGATCASPLAGSVYIPWSSGMKQRLLLLYTVPQPMLFHSLIGLPVCPFF